MAGKKVAGLEESVTKSAQAKQQIINVPLTRTDKWEGARIVDGEFKRALIDTSIEAVVGAALAPVFGRREWPVGTQVLVTVNITEPSEG